MADIFSATNERRNSVPTATFDWSHAVHTTTDLGRITPVFCELVPAKTSARINAKLGFQFMPMVFPLQSRIRYRLAFFKYPLRALWTDYRDFIGNFRQDLEEPYIDFQGSTPQTGSLWDYLGLPTTIFGNYGSSGASSPLTAYCRYSIPHDTIVSTVNARIGKNFFSMFPQGVLPDPRPTTANNLTIGCSVTEDLTVSLLTTGSVTFGTSTQYIVIVGLDRTGNIIKAVPCGSAGINITDFGSTRPSQFIFMFDGADSSILDTFSWKNVGGGFPLQGVSSLKVTTTAFVGESHSLSASTSPYYDSSNTVNKAKQLKVSAYAARAYEGIYNAWFRDNRNNPYYLNGQVEYNRWIPNYDGGADPASNYQLRYANWERDFLSTAVQTPQQGIAPLVGITTYEDTLTLDDGTVRTVNKLAITDEDGKSYKIGFDSDENGLKAVEYQSLGDAQTVKPTSLIQLAQSGISISDLRNVNAYQRYLEMNIRAGYSYKDIIEHRFDVNIGYNELLMPEFIGGTSDWVEMHSVTQTVMKEDNGTYADALGSQAGIAGARKGTETINVFCDEESIILGVLVFTPVPIYTQLLPKHFLYRGLLDHFAPEFANIGFQPILMREVAPVQQWNADKDKMLDTFGYNRPWYEYCQKMDTAHGLYRTQLRNFIMNRVFNEAPALNQSFLLVDPKQVNDVFAVTETTDKIYGQIYFDAKFKLPIPRVAIPRLE